MPTFLYRAVALEGQQQVEGAIDARDEREARATLRGRGILTLSISVAQSEETAADVWWRAAVAQLTYTPVKGGELTIYAQQMAALVEAGLPIIEVMLLLEESSANPTLRTISGAVRKDLLGGMMLSEAIARYPRVFSPLFINLTRAGEVSGQLEIMLARLSEMMEKTLELQRKVKAALTYPIFIAVTLVLVVTAVLVFVVPVFQKLYTKAGAVLPLPTRVLLGLSDGMRGNWVALVIGAIAAIVFFNWFSASAVGKPIIDRIYLRIPVLGRLLRETTCNTFARAFATVYGAGVAILPALESCRRLVGNAAIVEVLTRAEEGVKSGRPLSQGLHGNPYFPRILGQMFLVGESSGKLEEMINKGVAFSDKEIDYMVKQFTSMLEPILTAVIGLMVAFIAMALYLPLFDLPKMFANPGGG